MKPFEIALKEYGVAGIVGAANNSRILQFFKDIGHAWVHDDETAWCAAFMGWCLKQAGRPHTGSLAARSYLNYGSATQTPVLGDIVVLWRISKNSPYGHVGFYIKETPNFIYMLAGNHDGEVNIKRQPKGQLLAYRHIA